MVRIIYVARALIYKLKVRSTFHICSKCYFAFIMKQNIMHGVFERSKNLYQNILIHNDTILAFVLGNKVL